MSKKRLSLQSILEEERSQSEQEAPQATKGRAKKSGTRSKKVPEEPVDTREDKSDFIRLSITISPDDFERLQSESMTRRRERKTYTFSHLARIALGEWLSKIEREREREKR